MDNIKKSLGIIVLIIGVLLLAIPALTNATSNVTLGLGLLLVIAGFALHIVINKRLAR